jgi:hypothetical protein
MLISVNPGHETALLEVGNEFDAKGRIPTGEVGIQARHAGKPVAAQFLRLECFSNERQGHKHQWAGCNGMQQLRIWPIPVTVTT